MGQHIESPTQLRDPWRPVRACSDRAQGRAAPFEKAGIADDLDEGVIELDARASVGRISEAAKQQARLSESDA